MFMPLCTGDHSLPLLTTGVTSTGEKGLGDGRFSRVGGRKVLEGGGRGPNIHCHPRHPCIIAPNTIRSKPHHQNQNYNNYLLQTT